ncbi:hypothetical protein Dimus_018962 [Dionaea muscipula]
MEITSKLQERENPSPLNSPSSHGSNSLTTTNNGGTHIPITRSDPNSPYPTTFVTADTSSFKQVVQLLTGSSETSKSLSRQQQHQNPNSPDQNHLPHPPPHQLNSKNFPIPPIKGAPKKQQGFKLYERRNILRNSLMISPLTAAVNSAGSNFSPRKLAPPEILSPSLLDFPSLTLSPVTPLKPEDPFGKGSPSTTVGNSGSSAAAAEEQRAIAEKGFYFHPSPRSMANKESEPPQLLPLFPVTSPRASEA